jgi:hypothetical protein
MSLVPSARPQCVRPPHAVASIVLALAFLPSRAEAQESPTPPSEQEPPAEAPDRPRFFEQLTVSERADDLVGIAPSASSGTTGHEDLARRPLLRTGELLETVPGLIATQHSGGGKANQYFVRGFNLDHGTDFSVTVDGMPVNMPSHGHGQGYADVSFLIPELVDRIEYTKGTHSAAHGDFAAAGSVAIRLRPELPRGLARLSAGEYGYRRGLVAETFHLGAGRLTGAAELHRYDGPWERGDSYERVNGALRWYQGSATTGLSVTAMGYDASWLSTDQVPRRAVESGLIDRFGLIDPGPGGSTSRYSLSGDLRRGGDASLTRASAFLARYELELFSNFTYFLDDPADGDQFEQRDRRWIGGADVDRRWLGRLGERALEGRAGLQVRFDSIRNGLFRARDRQRLSTTRSDRIRQWGGGAYAEGWLRWSERFRSGVGLRADGYAAGVESDDPANSGSRSGALVSPKLSLVAGPWRGTELYANAGLGHHSNDARGATIRVDPVTGEPVQRVDPLVRAKGFELGVRTSAVRGLQSTLSVFGLSLDSEILFVGDAGATEASRPSERLGVEWANHYALGSWLFVDLDVALSRARFDDDDPAGDRIPGALERVVAAAVSVEGGPWSAGLRLRYFSGYPLIEDGAIRTGASALLNGRIGFAVAEPVQLRVEAFNLLDRHDSDVEYLYASRLPGEALDGAEDVHFHPVEKRSVRVTLDVAF